MIAALAAPPLAALLVSVWLSHRRLAPAVLGSSALFAAAAALPGRSAHAVFAALALASLLVVVVQSLQGAREPWGAWRDYVTLTKPRIMSLLLVTGVCGMIAGARGSPGTNGSRRHRRPCARVRRSERVEPRARPRHRPAHG